MTDAQAKQAWMSSRMRAWLSLRGHPIADVFVGVISAIEDISVIGQEVDGRTLDRLLQLMADNYRT